MSEKYTYPEEQPQMVREDFCVNYPTNGIADAIWTLIMNQTAEVQAIIAERLNKLRSKPEVKPYTIAELNARIDEAEQQMVCGETLSGEEVHKRMRNIINNI